MVDIAILKEYTSNVKPFYNNLKQGEEAYLMDRWEAYLDEHRQRHILELKEFLRIPSISSLADHRQHVYEAAEWIEARMAGAGIESVRIMRTDGHPVVYGDWLRAPGKPTVLIYGHFDVQPVDPLDLWENPPFEPVIKDERIYARGASDDKGNMFIPITVAEALLETLGGLPVNAKFLFEGQEEIGSPQLPDFISDKADLLKCDLVVNADGSQWDEEQPALVLGTRGLVSVFLDVEGPDHDLHSGVYGGTVANPIHALARIVDSMHDVDGRVAVEGFYDDVRSLTDEERRQMARVPFEEADYLGEIGSPCLFGEPGFTNHERAWARPTLEVNGIYGGFQGEGIKTVLPSTAHAKISCRIVADQDPSRIADLVMSHVKRVSPDGVKTTTAAPEKGAMPYIVPADHPGLHIAGGVLRDIYGKEPYRVRSGGTVPVNFLFLQYLNAYTIVFAFGLRDERIHSPNEFFRLESFARGQKAYGMLLHRLAEEFG
jgi:acetylornithine deacetylase/succinyl-diaminopimelate desuccinylase-like protein